MNLNWFKKRAAAATSEVTPCAGIRKEELAAALAVIDTLGPEVDRGILGVEVMADDRLEITTGHTTGPLNAHLDILTLRRDAGGWRVADHVVLDS